MVAVFYPVINMLTDPDSINQKILTYIQQQPQSETIRKKTYAYAASFEDFIQMIKNCNDTEVLKHIRYVHYWFWLKNGITYL
jgi:sorting nexin-25